MRVKVKNRSHRYDINRTRPRRGNEHTKYKMSKCGDGYV